MGEEYPLEWVPIQGGRRGISDVRGWVGISAGRSTDLPEPVALGEASDADAHCVQSYSAKKDTSSPSMRQLVPPSESTTVNIIVL